eukprot:387235-Rhodomonas_salina.2
MGGSQSSCTAKASEAEGRSVEQRASAVRDRHQHSALLPTQLTAHTVAQVAVLLAWDIGAWTTEVKAKGVVLQCRAAAAGKAGEKKSWEGAAEVEEEGYEDLLTDWVGLCEGGDLAQKGGAEGKGAKKGASKEEGIAARSLPPLPRSAFANGSTEHGACC